MGWFKGLKKRAKGVTAPKKPQTVLDAIDDPSDPYFFPVDNAPLASPHREHAATSPGKRQRVSGPSSTLPTTKKTQRDDASAKHVATKPKHVATKPKPRSAAAPTPLATDTARVEDKTGPAASKAKAPRHAMARKRASAAAAVKPSTAKPSSSAAALDAKPARKAATLSASPPAAVQSPPPSVKSPPTTKSPPPVKSPPRPAVQLPPIATTCPPPNAKPDAENPPSTITRSGGGGLVFSAAAARTLFRGGARGPAMNLTNTAAATTISEVWCVGGWWCGLGVVSIATHGA